MKPQQRKQIWETAFPAQSITWESFKRRMHASAFRNEVKDKLNARSTAIKAWINQLERDDWGQPTLSRQSMILREEKALLELNQLIEAIG